MSLIRPTFRALRRMNFLENRSLRKNWRCYSWIRKTKAFLIKSGEQVQNGCYLGSQLSWQSRNIQSKSRTGDHVDVQVIEGGRFLTFSHKDGFQDRFHSVWLRHNCHSPRSKQKHSGQKIIDVADVDTDIRIREIEIHDVGNDTTSLKISWHGEEHPSEIPVDFLLQNSYCKKVLDQQRQDVRPRVDLQEGVPTMLYTDMVNGELGLKRWLENINEHGFCVLEGVPTDDGMVAKVAEHISPVQQTIYGRVFDVISTPNPINVAYSDIELDFHQDLIYYESPPGLQFLHSVRFDECVEGGESIFLDVFHIADEFRMKHPQHFETLTRIPATFQKVHYQRETPVHMVYQRPHIVLNHNLEITGVNWAPAFEGPLKVSRDMVEDYYRAYHLFAAEIKTSEAVKQTILKTGDLVAFNNRRMLHGRKGFQLNGGVRHLQGCYVNIDEYKNRVNYFAQQTRKPVRRVGNQDCL